MEGRKKVRELQPWFWLQDIRRREINEVDYIDIEMNEKPSSLPFQTFAVALSLAAPSRIRRRESGPYCRAVASVSRRSGQKGRCCVLLPRKRNQRRKRC